ncbi:MAG: hypothetical protein PF487_11075 [Bacteroidales bacterium]|jgi:hypothetical protein|nr:hypothetical protein [Bacteroidales bacterium]
MKKQINKKSNYLMFLTSLSVLLMVSCQSPIKRKITNNGIQKDIIEIEEKTEDLKPIHKSFLNYLEKFHSKSNEANALVDVLEKSGLNYKSVFLLLDSLEIKLQPYELKRKEIVHEIDSTCTAIQLTIDNQQKLRDSLNNIITPYMLITSKKVLDNYDDVIKLKTMIKNTAEKPIQKVSFDLIFTNSNNLEFNIPCEYNKKLVNKAVHNFIFDEGLHHEYFLLLNTLEFPAFSSSYQIKSIMYADGQTSYINQKYYYNDLYKDENYTNSVESMGYCPYLTRYDDLCISLNVTNENYINVVEEEASFLKDFIIKYLENNINE